MEPKYKTTDIFRKAFALERRVAELELALTDFVDRVDRGEIRSIKTYNKFKKLLER